MKRLLLVCCFVMLLIALSFITSRVNFGREAGIADPDAIPTLEHDWAVGDQPGLMIGLLGYSSGTVVCYGSGYFWVPIIPAASLALLVVIVFMGALYFPVSCLPRSR